LHFSYAVLLSVFENLIRKNADNHNTDLEQYIESYQFLKEKNIISLSELKESIEKIYDRVRLIDQAEKYLKHKDTYKAYTKLKRNKQDTFYNEYTAEIILFERAFRRKQNLKYIQMEIRNRHFEE